MHSNEFFSFDSTQQKILAWAPKPIALISFLCAVYFFVDIARHQARRCKVYHRLIMAMMLCSAIFSVACFIGPWAMPSQSEKFRSSGTVTTCTVQGFALIFFGAAITHYYSMLALFAHIAVKCDFNEEILRRFEPLFHILSLCIPLSFAIFAVALNFVHGNGAICTILEHPSQADCHETHCDDDCISMSYKILTNVLLVDYIIAFAVSVIFIISVCKLEKKKIRVNLTLHGKKQFVEDFRKLKAKSVVKQGALYAFSFYFTIFVSGIARVAQSATDKYDFEFILLAMISRCMQGIVVSIVYDQTRIKELPTSHLTRKGRQNSSTLVSDIQKRLTTTKTPTHQQAKRRSSKSIPFSIFDGTSPSSAWADHIYSDDENDTEYGNLPGDDDRNVSTVIESSEEGVVSVDESFFYPECNKNICENVPGKS